MERSAIRGLQPRRKTPPRRGGANTIKPELIFVRWPDIGRFHPVDLSVLRIGAGKRVIRPRESAHNPARLSMPSVSQIYLEPLPCPLERIGIGFGVVVAAALYKVVLGLGIRDQF